MTNHFQTGLSTSPYPGLRPFRRDESDIFFGRDEQVDELLAKLEDHQFLAVVGSSGCGKSSLVRAGLLAALERGFMASAGPRWRIVEMRPGNQPLSNLARSLLQSGLLGKEWAKDAQSAAFLRASLRRGPRSLVELLRESPKPQRTNFLLLVDQFEEIFRFREHGDVNEANAFVNLLLATAAQEQVSVYVVITMRSDYIGDCSLFMGLPEALNKGQFLTPRLTREQCRAAIVGPAAAFGTEVEPALVNRILNDMGTDPDQLPLMQHTLMRIWTLATKGSLACQCTGEGDEVSAEKDSPKCPTSVTTEHYGKVGGMKEALSNHADEIYHDSLDEAGRHVAEVLFRCLSERGEEQRDTRRPVALETVAKVADAPVEQVIAVVEAFRCPGCSFIMPPVGVPLAPDTVLDISHESLIRQWERMSRWVRDEAESAAVYRRLSESARLWDEGKAALLRTPELQVALCWKKFQQPTPAWAARYGGDFELSMRFLDQSVAARDKSLLDEEERRKNELELLRQSVNSEKSRAESAVRHRKEQAQAAVRSRRLALIAVGVGLVAICLAAVALVFFLIARTQRGNAEYQRDRAEDQRAKANKARKEAVYQRDNAEGLRRIATAQQLVAHANSLPLKLVQRRVLLTVEAANVTSSWGRVPLVEQALRNALASCGGHPLSGHLDVVNAVTISPDNRWLATGSDDKTARLWDLTARNPSKSSIVLAGHTAGITLLALSPDNRWLVTAGRFDSSVRLWDLTAEDPSESSILLRGHKEGEREGITTLGISPDSHWLVTGSSDQTARLWDLTAEDPSTTSIVLPGHRGRILHLLISPDSRWLVTLSYEDIAYLWDLTASDPFRTRTVLRGHKQPITSVVITSDSRWLATGSYDNTVRLWDLNARRDLSLMVSPSFLASMNTTLLNGRRLLSCSLRPLHAALYGSLMAYYSLHLCILTPPIEFSKPSFVLSGHEGSVLSMDVSSDNRWIATASADDTARLWDLMNPDPSSGTPIEFHGHEGHVTAVAIGPDNHWLATGSTDGKVRMWDLTLSDPAKASVELRGPEERIIAVAFTPDDHWLVVRSLGETVCLWDLTARDPSERRWTLRGHEGPVLAAAISPDGHWLATASTDGIPRLWDLTTPDPSTAFTVFGGHERSIGVVAVSPDNRWLVTGDTGGTARLWNLTASEPAKACLVLRGHESAILALAISPDNRRLVTGSADKTGRLWDLAASDPSHACTVLPGHESAVYAVAISSDSRWLVTAGWDKTARLWDLTAPDAPQPSIVLRGHERPILAVAISPDNRSLVTGSADNTGRVWDLTAPDVSQAFTVLRGHEKAIVAVAISPDNHWLVTAGADKTARLWDLSAADPSKKPIVLHGHEYPISALGISSDSRWLVTGSDDGAVRLWDLAAEDPSGASALLTKHEGPITAIAISPCDRWLLTASTDNSARMCDLTSPHPAGTQIVFRAHAGPIWDIAISRDGRWAVTASADRTARVWPLGMDDLLAPAGRITGRNLTLLEWKQYFPGEPYRKTFPDLP